MDKSTGAWAFLGAIADDFGAKMSGPVSAIFAAIALFWPNLTPEPRRWFWVLAALSFLLSAYFVWAAERRRVIQLEIDLAAAKDQRTPDLRAHIEQAIFGESAQGTLVTLKVAIRNLAAPSVALAFRPIAEVQGQQVRCEVISPTQLTLGAEGGGAITIRPPDFIFEKTTQPIPSGGFANGYLATIFPGMAREQIRIPGTKITIRFVDVTGKEIFATYEHRADSQHRMGYSPDGTGASGIQWGGPNVVTPK